MRSLIGRADGLRNDNLEQSRSHQKWQSQSACGGGWRKGDEFKRLVNDAAIDEYEAIEEIAAEGGGGRSGQGDVVWRGMVWCHA